MVPAFAARIACATEKINVTFVLIPSADRSLQAIKPSRVQGSLIVTLGAIL